MAVLLLLSQPLWKPVEQTLSDGTILRIEAVTFGTNHSFSTHPIREKVRSVLPRRLQPFLGKGNFSHRIATTHNALVLWTLRFDPVSNTYVRWQNEQLYTTDEHGCRFKSNYRSGATLVGKSISGVIFDAFPRTEKHFEYVVCDSSGNVLGKLGIVNPIQSKSQPWTPEKVPITKTNTGLIVELRRFWRWNSQTRVQPDIAFVRPRDSELWDKGPVWLRDSSGNRILFGQLCTNERAWKIDAHFFRKARAEFRPDEIWAITNVAIPKPGEVVALNKTNTLQGCLMAVGSLQGAGYIETGREVRRSPAAGRPVSIPPEAPTLFIWSRPGNEEIRIDVRAQDDSGQKLVSRPQEDRAIGYWFRPISHWKQQFDIHPFPASKSIDIEVLVQKPNKFEFFVAPSQATASD